MSLIAKAELFGADFSKFEKDIKTFGDAKKKFEVRAWNLFKKDENSLGPLHEELKKDGLKKAAKKVNEWQKKWPSNKPEDKKDTSTETNLVLARDFEKARKELRDLPGYKDFRKIRKEVVELVTKEDFKPSQLDNAKISKEALDAILKLQKYKDRIK